MESERSIIEKLSHSLNEGCPMYGGITDNTTDTERELINLTAVYEFMISKGFDELPDSTTEKRCLIDIYNKLKELGLNLTKPTKVNTPEFPGSFESLV